MEILRRIVRGVLCIVLVVVLVSPVNAYVFTGRKQPDPANVKFSVSNTISQYVYRIITYAETWETYCDPIGIGMTSVGDENIYVYGEISVDSGSYAITAYNGTGSYSVITIYKPFVSLTVSEQNETIVHEFGHALGLDHCQESAVSISVMRRLGFNGYAHPLSDDITGILALYPLI